MDKVKDCTVRPSTSLNLLSRKEILTATETDKNVFRIFRNCALAVLNTGNETDDAAALLDEFSDFKLSVISEPRGIKLRIQNAPASAFVDGKLIRGIQEHLFAVLRDIVYTQAKIESVGGFDMHSGEGITDAVFRILRNAGVVKPSRPPGLIVCWGGHSISREEYEYSKEVGYELGLRGLDIATGCGIGAMKGPMKGAMIGHAKQKITNGRYVGITEPGIIASESPNPSVSELVILPDIEKRLEAFVRLAHCIIVFPGGVGTIEEILYLLGILLKRDNLDIPVPVIFTAPAGFENYFTALDTFIRDTLGEEATRMYEIVNADARQVAQFTLRNLNRVVSHRRKVHESYAYNWGLTIPENMQKPFVVNHENMANIKLSRELPKSELIAELRKAFSGVVAGNVKPYGIQQINKLGPFRLAGDPRLMHALDQLLEQFVSSKRMKIGIGEYKPCYELVPL